MKDSKGMDQGQYKSNDKYMKMMSDKSQKIMKNHGNTSLINADAQSYDMARCQMRGPEMKGSPKQSFDYKH